MKVAGSLPSPRADATVSGRALEETAAPSTFVQVECFHFQHAWLQVRAKFHRTVSSKCLDHTRKFLHSTPSRSQKKMAAPFGAAVLGESERLEERNPQVKTTPRLLSPWVTRHCSAFDRPLFDSSMIDTIEKRSSKRFVLSDSLSRRSPKYSHGCACARRHRCMVIFVTPVAVYVTAKHLCTA